MADTQLIRRMCVDGSKLARDLMRREGECAELRLIEHLFDTARVATDCYIDGRRSPTRLYGSPWLRARDMGVDVPPPGNQRSHYEKKRAMASA